MNQIIEDFSTIRLKEDRGARFLDRRYTIAITTNNEIKENFSETKTLYLYILMKIILIITKL